MFIHMNFIDLNLPSGTKWSKQAIKKSIFELTDEERKMLPTDKQLLELARYCHCTIENKDLHFWSKVNNPQNVIIVPHANTRLDETVPIIIKSDDCMIATIWFNRIFTFRYQLSLREPTYVLFVKT